MSGEKGSFTVEAAIIVPFITGIIAVFLMLTMKRYNMAVKELSDIKESSEELQRCPAEIINNTELISEYIENILGGDKEK